MAKEDTQVADEINDVETYLFLPKENDKANDFFHEAIIMHNILVGNLWQYNL